MLDIIPPDLYFPIHINLCLAIVLLVFLHSYIFPIEDKKNLTFMHYAGYLFMIYIIFFIGTRPVSGGFFGDMIAYNRYFTYYSAGNAVDVTKDAFFHYFMKFCSYIMSVRMFFLLCAFLYIYPLFKASKTFFEKYWFYAFLMFVVSFSFWTYGTNGIRNGIATSVFLLAISFHRNKLVLISFLTLSSLIHQTLLLPILAFSLSYFFKNSKIYVGGWLLAIPLSIALGGFWESLFVSLGFGDDRMDAYLLGEGTEDDFTSTGFRYDFLIYSAIAVFTGWYFIFKRNFNDEIYINIFNTYVISNAFWILVIRANFSNRFAYLSWFLMGLVIIYPFLKAKFFERHHFVIGKVIVLYFMFTYLMYYIYYDR